MVAVARADVNVIRAIVVVIIMSHTVLPHSSIDDRLQHLSTEEGLETFRVD